METGIVPLDYHVVIDKNHYSLPYEYVKHEVEIRTTPKVIEVFYNHMRIASHLRIVGKENQFVTIPEHMPDNHRMYIEWDKEYILQWAHQVGENTHTVVNAIYGSSRVEKQAQAILEGKPMTSESTIVKLNAPIGNGRYLCETIRE